MRKLLLSRFTSVSTKRLWLFATSCLLSLSLAAQQLPNAGFEDWSGAAFNGNAQPASWNASNVSQFGFNFNFAHQEAGHTGSYSLMVQDTEVGALGITETSPGYFSLGQPFAYVPSLTQAGAATAGTEGGVAWTYRPDSMSVWIKRTGNNVAQEDFYLLYYAWSGTAKSSKYMGKNGSCTSTTRTNEESDIRQALDGNECGTDQKVTQIAEGMWREKKEYGQWTNIRVPIYYMNSDAPTMMNIIFSASNYPNFRATTGLYAGNSLYVDDVELIYSASIQKLFIDDKEWKGFDPNSSEEQTYSLGRSATSLPKIEARRGAGELTNARGTTATFAGRVLSGSEITIQDGTIDGDPTVITVRSEDGTKQQVYKIKFVREPSKNAKLATILVNDEALEAFNPSVYTYTVDLPYGTTETPVVAIEKQEDEQTVSITQPESTTGRATIRVTAADGQTTATYTLNFRVAELADNTLQDILVNGKSVPGFIPSQTIYRVSLPTSTTTMPTITAVSAYPEGEQTIVHTAPSVIDGGSYQISVTTPGNQVPKVYKLNFKLEASSYSYLSDLQVEGGYIQDFSPETFTYYVTLPLGTTTLPNITYELGDDTQTVSVSEGGIDGTTRITVTAANGDQTVYKIVFTTLKSEISTLSGIRIGGVDLEGFSPDKTEYTYTLPVGTTELPEIEPVKGDEYQTVTIIAGGLNGTTRITVTAGNGSTTVYQITFSVLQATDATLRMIYLDGVELEGFDKNQLEYTIQLPQGTTKQPEVTWEQNDEFQKVTPRPGSGVEDDYRITVRAQSGASQTYILHFQVTTSSNTALSMIYVDDEPLADFDPEQTDYSYTLPVGVSTLPSVRFDKADDTQRVLTLSEDNVYTITVTAENGDRRTYTITFIIQKSENAFLQMIYLDGEPLEGFDPQTLAYSIPLQGATCPAITVDKEAGQQVTITAPYATGQAFIRVLPESGAANTYTLTFTATVSEGSLLQDILLDGVSLPDFDPQTLEYTLSYTDALPEVTYTAQEGQTVQVLRDKQNVILYVETDGTTVAYTLHFRKESSSDTALAAILLDGVEFSDYTPETHDYTIDLPAGSTLPVVTYRKASDKQVVFLGQASANQSAITVVAENGDQATYTLTFPVALYDDPSLADLRVEAHTLTFDPEQTDYTLSLEEGATLPALSYTARPGQNIILTETSETEQQVLVVAESGATRTYTVTYERVVSTNALLSDLLIDGVSIDGFEPTRFNYVDTLAWRTTVVPSVFAVGQLANQTITTYFSAVNGTTTIHVVAADGVTANDYTIAFPVRKSSNTALADLFLNSDIATLTFSPDVLDYEIWLPYQSTEAPMLVYERAEEEQQVEYISRPLGQTNEIIVTAENGDQRTYTVLFRDSLSEEANLLESLSIVETGESLDVNGTDYTIALPYGTRTLTVDYTKHFDEQTVWVQPGGIYHPTIITVRSNRPDDPDHVYTLTPALVTQNPAVLQSIVVNNAPIPDFDPNRFSYVINVESTPIVGYVEAEGARVSVRETNSKCWQAQVTAQGQTNTYTLWFYYPQDTIPNTEFDRWEDAAKHGRKPVGWNTLGNVADSYKYTFATFTPGDEVTQDGTDVVKLVTKYNSVPLAGTIPGYTTLGTINYRYGTWGSSQFSVSGGIIFRNTPDILTSSIRATDITDNNRIVYQAVGSLGSSEVVYANTTKQSDFETITLDLTGLYNTVGIPSQMNIILNSFHTESGQNGSHSAELYVDWVRIAYNSTLSSLTVNDIPATLTDHAFSVTLADPEDNALPRLAFVGEVEDQAQRITWQDEVVEEGYAVRRADILNYAEDGSSTAYTLEVHRPIETRNTLRDLRVAGATIERFDSLTTDYTVHLASTTRHLPDIHPVASSSLQTITTAPADSVYTITVTSEAGEERAYTIRFVTDLSDDTTLASLSGVESFDPLTTDYTIAGETLSEISFAKKMDGQTVHYTLVDTLCTLLVTAENGAQATYTIRLQQPETHTTGQLSELELNGNVFAAFAPDTYDYTYARPTLAAFTRAYAEDSVVFVQTDTHMQWQVYGSENHTYTLTYPVDLSSNTQLASILLNGEAYADFSPSVRSYTIYTDEPVELAVVKAEAAQHVTTLVEPAVTTYAVVPTPVALTYTITVRAEDGTEGPPYNIYIQPSLSSDAYLAGILLDDEPIADFAPETLQYTVTLPVGEVKITEPLLPSLTYLVGQEAQSVELTPGALGEPTYLTVTSEDGKQVQEYTVLVQSEASHNADLSAIIVNGTPIDRFEPERHYYSVRSTTSDITLEWTSEDNFQTVTPVNVTDNIHVLHVVAEDGTTAADYMIEVFVDVLSDNATLAEILLDGKAFADFEHDLNPRLAFDPMQHYYTIALPAGTTILPEVSARLQEDGQHVSISSDDMMIYIDVTAQDGITVNRYTLDFVVPLSSNADLGMIYLDGDSLTGFVASTYFYSVTLPVGVHTLPEVVAQRAETAQQVTTTIDAEARRATIHVLAEDGAAQATYTLAFAFTKSDADTLTMIYADGLPIETFAPRTFYYTFSLPVGTTAFPALEYDRADEWQTVTEQTVEQTDRRRVQQFVVTAESGRSNTYTLTYDILLSDVDTLAMIYVDDKPLSDFAAKKTEYNYIVPAGTTMLPTIYPLQGDAYQTVTVTETDDATAGTIGTKAEIEVLAANGSRRVYTIRFPRELSSEALLNMIYVDGSPLSNFDEERFSYTVSLPMDANAIPVITVSKKEAAQQVEIEKDNDTVRVVVTAENGATQTYTLVFSRVKSDNANLSAILLDGVELADFESAHYDYPIVLPYGTTALPTITPVKAEEDQQVAVSDPVSLSTGEQVVVITVTAPNGDDMTEYTLTFTVAKNSDASLTALYVRGVLLPGFHADTTDYTLSYPAGTDPADLPTIADLTYTLSDPEATVELSAEASTLMLTVTAQDATVRSYIIHQLILADTENALSMIYLDDVELVDFDPERDFYTYYIVSGMSAPKVTADALSDRAEVSIKEVSVGDTCIIICTAESGDARRYYVWFAESDINDALAPTANDVLVKHLAGSTQILVATTRKDVTFGLYDMYGHLVALEKLEAADPNDVEMATDAYGKDVLLDISNMRSGRILSLDPSTIYFYVFFEGENRRIHSGKLMIHP